MSKQDLKEETKIAMGMLGKGYNGDPIPSTFFAGTMSGYTPAPDILVKEYGFVTALVWGRIWRYCQMADGVCRASLKKIGEGLGMSERTIIRHSDLLCDGGYLYDTTPELKNKPHIYADTGKIKIRFNVEAGMTLSHTRVTESHPQGDRESVEDSIKREEKKEERDLPDPIFLALENLTGGLNTNTPRFVDTWREKHTDERILEAIALAKTKGRKPVQYVDSILVGWEANGYPKSREERVKDRQVINTKTRQVDAGINAFLANHQEVQNGQSSGNR